MSSGDKKIGRPTAASLGEQVKEALTITIHPYYRTMLDAEAKERAGEGKRPNVSALLQEMLRDRYDR